MYILIISFIFAFNKLINMYIIKKLLLRNPYKIIGIFIFIYLLNALITLSAPVAYNEQFDVVSVSYMGDQMIASNGTEIKAFDSDQEIINNVIYYKNYDLMGIFLLLTVLIFITLVTGFLSNDSSINWGLVDIKLDRIRNRIEMIKVDDYYYYIDTLTEKLLFQTPYGESVPYYILENYSDKPENFVIFNTPIKKRNKSIDSILN